MNKPSFESISARFNKPSSGINSTHAGGKIEDLRWRFVAVQALDLYMEAR